ncbi:HAD-IC family P-type ATPase [Collinsella sp. An2]|uniref:HAD-IC family P-type ATPase n=1 Tax=Collinsella sp. An2 TaxID=1965585 RepID=UPI000B3A4821|nr:HAD-IC family P-type ATPase [Collinsella sp. An2]OUP08272.1 haloacid dehalogenase [Collinsella sp. An2]
MASTEDGTRDTQPAADSGGYTAEPLHGLSSEEVAERIAAGKINVNMELKTKSVRELLLENLLTLFNLINVILAVLVIIAGSWKNLTFLAIVLLNTLIGVVQSLRSKRMVDKLTLLATKKAVCIRDGAEVELDLDQIVLDDLVKLGRGDQIPADAVVVTGEAQVNESLLTGESDLIRKQPGSELMSGSFIDSGVVFARVVHVGADNYVAKINNEAKYVKKVNSEIMNSLNAIVRFASVVMVPLGLALFISSLNESYIDAGSPGSGLFEWVISEIGRGHVPSAELLTTVGALLGMIPQGLVLLTSSVLAIATMRLARRRVLAQQLYCIETLARVDVLCLDKTGTITSGRMEVAGTYPLPIEGGTAQALEGVPSDVPVLDFALANIARATSMDANETCKALLDHYEVLNVPVEDPLTVVPFSSAKKWSGASFRQGSFVMGAAQFVLSPEDYASIEGEVSRLADTCRVLVVAMVDGFTDEGEMVGRARPVGLVTIRDEIRSSAAETIGYFNEQGVTLNVISGDDPRTVSSIAKVVGVPGADAYVDATTLDTPAKIDAAVERYHVFGRVTPQQKRELVQALQRRGHTVAMTGDGVNDVLALKEADCSVAMAAGSDAARNVAEIVLIDNDFAAMPAVVAEGRRSINNLQRSAALFLTKTLFSMGLAAICIAFPPYPFQPIQMTLINFFCIGYPGFVLGLEANRARVEGSFLVNVIKRALPASVAVVLAACLNMAGGAFFGVDEATLSTMCLISSSFVGCCLIWRISQPFTPLRAVLLASIVAGLVVGIFGFTEFFSIARLGVATAVWVVVVAAIGALIFFKLAAAMDRRNPKGTRSATGFGRGVRVRLGRRGTSSVTSTGSAPRRFLRRVRDGVAGKREQRELQKSAMHAARAVKDAGSGSARTKKRASVTKSAQGIKVTVPRRKRDRMRDRNASSS